MISFAAFGALDVLVQETEMPEDAARTILNHLQLRLNHKFGGQPETTPVISNVLDFLESACPAPPTHRWYVSSVGTGTAYVNLVPRNGIPEGYSFAARVTIGFEGGSHPLKGDLWKHDDCGCLIFPGDHQAHERFHAGLRSQAA